MNVITVTNVKGGVGKSISALFFANILSSQGKRILLIDMDSQNSLTSFFVDNYTDIDGKTILEVLTNKLSISDSIIHIKQGLDFLPADITLCNLTLQLSENRDFKLYMVLEGVRSNYDYVIIDTPPSLHIETKLALAISNYIVIPTRLEKWSTRSISIMTDYIQNKNIPLQQIIKTEMKHVSILPTHLVKNSSLQPVILEELAAKYGSMLIEGISRRADLEKISFIGRDMNLNTIEAYGEYETALSKILA
jgi:chromosome partitioning protein